MLYLHHSNRLEILAGVLSERMRMAPGCPLDAERIVVAHRSMARWLSLELASAQGIAANLRFELPAEFAWSIMRAALPGMGGERAYTPGRLRWRIHDALPAFAEERGEPSVASVHTYLAEGGPRERFKLADRLSQVFDRCLLYRPDWIREWARNPPPHWQDRLWLHLVEAERERALEQPAGQWVSSIDAFRHALASGAPAHWPRSSTRLAAMQRDILELRPAREPDEAPPTIGSCDDSTRTATLSAGGPQGRFSSAEHQPPAQPTQSRMDSRGNGNSRAARQSSQPLGIHVGS